MHNFLGSLVLFLFLIFFIHNDSDLIHDIYRNKCNFYGKLGFAACVSLLHTQLKDRRGAVGSHGSDSGFVFASNN